LKRKRSDESFDWLRINIEEATGTSYTGRNSLCLAFYKDFIIIVGIKMIRIEA